MQEQGLGEAEQDGGRGGGFWMDARKRAWQGCLTNWVPAERKGEVEEDSRSCNRKGRLALS